MPSKTFWFRGGFFFVCVCVKGEAAPTQILPFTLFCGQLCIFIFNLTSLCPRAQQSAGSLFPSAWFLNAGPGICGVTSHVRWRFCHRSKGLLRSLCSLREFGTSGKRCEGTDARHKQENTTCGKEPRLHPFPGDVPSRERQVSWVALGSCNRCINMRQRRWG